MTQAEYKEHFKALLTAEVTYKEKVYTSVKIDQVDAYVNRCIIQGLKDFWTAWSWRFRAKTYELAITSQDESYTLPTDFDGMLTIREKNSGTGLRLQFLPKEDFDRAVPKETLLTSGDPEFYTVFFDGTAKKISFSRRPSDQTLYLYYNATPPAAVEKVPDYAQACLESYIAKHVYPHGHPGRRDAIIEAENEKMKLQVMDKGSHAAPRMFQTDSDYPNHVNPFYWATSR